MTREIPKPDPNTRTTFDGRISGYRTVHKPRLKTLTLLGFLLALSIGSAATALLAAGNRYSSSIPSANGISANLTKAQTNALDAYNDAVAQFKWILSERRAQIQSNRPLPDLPGQALYLARIETMSAYKNLTDVVPSLIGRPNKFGIPPQYFDADIEPLVDEYKALFAIMQAPPVDAQNSRTPFRDVVDVATAIAHAKGLDSAHARIAGQIAVGIFFAETDGNQNIGNARSNKYKGSFQTGTVEDWNGRKKWATIRGAIATFDPALIARDDAEEARVGTLDHRFNHWTAVRDGLMNAQADLFPQIAVIVHSLPDAIDQMKFFELLQIIPTPTRSALTSGKLGGYVISDPKVMGYLRNNSIFAFGQADRAKTSATLREILDAMWLFDDKFARAIAKVEEITAERK